jgi:hypothetical protein
VSRSLYNNDLKQKEFAENCEINAQEYDNENENIITINNINGTDREMHKSQFKYKSFDFTTDRPEEIEKDDNGEPPLQTDGNVDPSNIIEEDKTLNQSKSTPSLNVKSKRNIDEKSAPSHANLIDRTLNFNFNNPQNVLSIDNTGFNTISKLIDSNYFSKNFNNIKDNEFSTNANSKNAYQDSSYKNSQHLIPTESISDYQKISI